MLRVQLQAAGYQLRVENEAKGNASRFEQILTQYNKAPQVTRQRLYIDAQEQILSSTSKLLIDQKAGNNLIYLPLDKLMATTGGAAPAKESTSAVAPANEASSASSAEESDRSRDAFRSRDRETR